MTAATGTAPADVAAWMDAAIAGDRAAYGRLYERYRPVVHRFVRARIGSPQITDDLTADTFTKGLARIHTFTWQGRDPGAWFVTIARNLVADHFKAAARRELSFDPTPHIENASARWWINIVDPGADRQPELATLSYLNSVEVLTALRGLTAEQRQCLTLRFLHGLSVTETARAMGKHEGAVKALAYRAARAAARAIRHPEPRRPAPPGPPPAPAATVPPRPQPPTEEPMPVIPRPREPVDDEPADDEPADDEPAGEATGPRIMWRCRDCHRTYARPYLTHGAPDSCQGWLEPIEVTW